MHPEHIGCKMVSLKAHSHEDEISNETSNGGVTLDAADAANVSRLTFRHDQTLLDPNITFEIRQALIGLQ